LSGKDGGEIDISTAFIRNILRIVDGFCLFCWSDTHMALFEEAAAGGHGCQDCGGKGMIFTISF
jgi:hypothetical protein